MVEEGDRGVSVVSLLFILAFIFVVAIAAPPVIYLVLLGRLPVVYLIPLFIGVVVVTLFLTVVMAIVLRSGLIEG